MENLPDIRYLLLRYMDDTASTMEQYELFELLGKYPDSELAIILQHIGLDQPVEELVLPAKHKHIADRILSENIRVQPIVHRVHFLRTAWFRVAVAILIILTGFFIYNEYSHTAQPDREVAIDQPSPKSGDILPGSSKAILTLSDGSKVELNNALSETITDGTLSIANNNGQLVYESTGLPIPSNGGVAPGGVNPSINPSGPGAGVGHGESMYNTMTTPRGGQYQLILPDGSRVWLNAESSITFPTTFTQNAREVKITGEAYFEIKPNAGKPFIVKTISDEIQVLGTSFNITAYKDAPVKTSLVQGSVKVNSSLLNPGEAFINGNIKATNLDQDIAWKNGYFNFDKMRLKQVMKQLERWYDVKVEYRGNITDDEFAGKMGRGLTLQEVLESLKMIGVHFTLKDKVLIVMP